MKRKMKRNLQTAGSCFSALIGFILLISAIMWLDEHWDELGSLNAWLLLLGLLVAGMIYQAKLKGIDIVGGLFDMLLKSINKKRYGEEGEDETEKKKPKKVMPAAKKTDSKTPSPNAEKLVDGEKIIIKRLAGYKPSYDMDKFFFETREMNENAWQFVLDRQSVSLLGENEEELYTVNYDNIQKLDCRSYRIYPEGASYKEALPYPTWAARLDDVTEILVERAKLEKIETTTMMRNEEVKTYYYGRKQK